MEPAGFQKKRPSKTVSEEDEDGLIFQTKMFTIYLNHLMKFTYKQTNTNHVSGSIKCWDHKRDPLICTVSGFIVIKDLISG